MVKSLSCSRRLFAFVLVLLAAPLYWSGALSAAVQAGEQDLHPYQQAVLDKDPIFYASFDGTVEPEIGPAPDGSSDFDDVVSVTPNGSALVGHAFLQWTDGAFDPEIFARDEDTTYEFWTYHEDVYDFDGLGARFSSSTRISEPNRESSWSMSGYGPLRSSSSYDGGFSSQVVSSSLEPPLSASEWHHYVAVVRVLAPQGYADPTVRTVDIEVYVDGVLVVTERGMVDRYVTADDGQGYRQSARISMSYTDIYVDGPPRFDEFAIYPRALTSEEILSHYELAEPVLPAPSLPRPDFSFSTTLWGQVNSTLWPECLVQVSSETGWCFETIEERDQYIASSLLGEAKFGDIWIGRFDEEVVAP